MTAIDLEKTRSVHVAHPQRWSLCKVTTDVHDHHTVDVRERWTGQDVVVRLGARSVQGFQIHPNWRTAPIFIGQTLNGRSVPRIAGGAFANSGGFGLTLRDIFQNDTSFDWLADTFKAAMFTNSITTPDFDTNTAYGVAPFNANQVSGTGYTAGGAALTSPTLTISPAGTSMFDSADVDWTTSTITNARGVLLYDDTTTTPVADPAWLAVTFGADYSTTAGLFRIQVPSTGWNTLDYTP